MPRECPPRPNVASITIPLLSKSTRCFTHSASMAGVCVPAACKEGRKPVCMALAALICKWRPPKEQPFQSTAACIASRVAKVIQPTP
eukprot:5896680-Pleurochrysis_carterae.AAC.3